MAESEQITGANYLINFFREMENLNVESARYIIYIVALKDKYPKSTLDGGLIDGITEEDNDILIQMAQLIKSCVYSTFIRHEALKGQIKEFQTDSDKIKAAYLLIRNKAIPNADLVEDYTIRINKLFCLGVVGEILVKADDLIKGFSN